MKSELERTRQAMELAVKGLQSISQGTCPSWLRSEAYEYMEHIDAILNPPPEFETVEVVRWECETCSFVFKTEPTSTVCIHPRENHMDPSETAYIKLTGTHQRAKKQPVELSVSVEFAADGDGDLISPCGNYWVNKKALGALLHFSEGQKATVTVTWQEER